MFSQDERKALVGRSALEYVKDGEIVGVGTGTTVNHFIDALAAVKHRVRGAVSSSEASTARLRAHGIAVFDCNAVENLSVYVDGADEIDPAGYMIKGGGAALTREKIVAAQSALFSHWTQAPLAGPDTAQTRPCAQSVTTLGLHARQVAVGRSHTGVLAAQTGQRDTVRMRLHEPLSELPATTVV